MTPQQSLKLFEGTTIRTIWDSEKEEWFFSVADVCNALSGSQAKDPNAYWRKLKQRLKAEGSEVVTNCHGLKSNTQLQIDPNISIVATRKYFSLFIKKKATPCFSNTTDIFTSHCYPCSRFACSAIISLHYVFSLHG